MIVGGYAVAWHGHPRFTKDLDLWYRESTANVERLRQALVRFGFRAEDLPVDAFTATGSIVTFGVAPTRVDLMNRIDGVTFEEALPNAVRGRYGRVEVTCIGLADLLRNKSSTPRARDKGDVEELGGA